jgi:hypothetical protein
VVYKSCFLKNRKEACLSLLKTIGFLKVSVIGACTH